MAKIENRKKQNPKLRQSELSDGRASLYLEYYIGRTETPVLDENGEQVLYTEGAMAGKPKFKIKHSRKKENLNLYIWLHPRTPQERLQNRNTLALAEKIRFEREQTFFSVLQQLLYLIITYYHHSTVRRGLVYIKTVKPNVA